jgi:hypothetical protein
MIKLIAALLAALTAIPPQDVGWCNDDATGHLPRWVCESSGTESLHEQVELHTGRIPAFLEADFDVDGQIDVAFWVTNRRSGRLGIAFMSRRSGLLEVLGANAHTDGSVGDYDVFDAWSIIPRGEVLRSNWEDALVELEADAILLEKTESASIAVYWSGGRLRQYALTE